ncbi:MAG: toll/interleukin-1 receptor domain-containing protein [Anaerolineae bacterium]|nr:toll/interleukin-1 receptor domain-containing protein [Anaerolineae bacterium]
MRQRSRTTIIVVAALLVLIIALLLFVVLSRQNIGTALATPTDAVATQASPTSRPATAVPTTAVQPSMVGQPSMAVSTTVAGDTDKLRTAMAQTAAALATPTLDLEPVSSISLSIGSKAYVDDTRQALIVQLSMTEANEIDHLDVSLLDAANQTVRDYPDLPVQPTITLDIRGLPAATYQLSITALSESEDVLASADTSFTHTLPAEGTAASNPTRVATLPVIVRSSSGQEIGRGTIRLYAPQKAVRGQSVTVELELYFDALAITPTPAGPITLVPVLTPKPTIERTANPASSATPRQLRLEKSEITIYERMGASLLCSAASFSGCDIRPNVADVRYLLLGEPTIWRWFIVPSDAAKGNQQLGIQLWSTVIINSAEAPQVMWSDTFSIEIVDSLAASSGISGAVLALIAVLTLALIGAGAVIYTRSTRTRRASGNRRVKVFISYRRAYYWAIADVIREHLVRVGADVFLDRDSIYEGRFEQIIRKAIEEREFFLLLLGPKTFESEWVRKEVQIALTANKRIIPVLVDGFNIASDPLPAGMETLRELNAINMSPEYRDEAIARIAKFIGLGEVKD